MKRAVVLVMVGVLSVLVEAACGSAVRAEILSTSTSFLKQAPVQITGYLWGSETLPDTGKNVRVLRYVQLYNASAQPIDLSTWSLVVQGVYSDTGEVSCNVSECPRFTLPDATKGLLAPNQHLIVDDGETVDAAWFGAPLTQFDEFQKSKVAVQFVLTAPGYQDVVVQVKPDIVPAAVDYYWQRGFSATGSGYVSSFTMTSVPPVALFNDGLYQLQSEAPLKIVEIYPYSQDCSPNSGRIDCGDYIKLHVYKNVDISSFVVRTDSSSSSRTTSNTFHLTDEMVHDEYVTVSVDDAGKRLNLTNSGGYIWIEDVYLGYVYAETMQDYPSAASDKQGLAWAVDERGNWQWTTTLRPDAPNVITPPVVIGTVCPTGKYLNPDTGRCRTLEEAVNALAACPEGQERNPTTNRCRSKTAAASTLTPCAEGQERNPATNRCRSISSSSAELVPCNEGYERNPATNRCRKVGATTAGDVKGATALPEDSDSWTTWTWALVAVGATGAIGYGVYEWRDELRGIAQKIAARFSKK